MRRPRSARAREPLNDELAQARDQLLRLLRFRPRSVPEARERLKKAGYSASVVAHIIQEAKERGWLDDEVFAKLWVQDRLMTKPKGPALLREELKAKGIAKEHIDRALRGAHIDEEQLIQKLIEQQAARYRSDDRATRARKLYAFLRRRGFGAEAIRRALRGSSLL